MKFVLLRRFASPCRWSDVELLFGKPASLLSEIFWETLERFLEIRGDLLTGYMNIEFLEEKAAGYAAAVKYKTNSL